MHDNRECFTVTLEALPDLAPGAIRLRRFLKAALRSYRLRCTALVELPDDSPVSEPIPILMEDTHVG